MDNVNTKYRYVAGDLIPVLNKKIDTIILVTKDFIVFLDDKHSIEWLTEDGYDGFSKDYGHVINKVRRLETINESLFSGEKLKKYNSLVAEGVARLLDERQSKNALEILDEADKQIVNQGVQKHRINYILSSAVCSTIVAIVIYLLFICKSVMSLTDTAHAILTASFFGGIGSFISAYFRSQNYTPDVSIKTSIHVLDGSLRIFYGIIAGTMVSLGIKGNVIFGFISDESDKSHMVMAFFCLIAGASEFLVPNLIKQVEGKANE